MSVGLQLLRAVIETQSRATMRSLTEELFLPDEITAFNFVSAFYRRHGQLPTLEAMTAEGFRLPSAQSPPDHYLERTRSRAVFNSILAEQNGLADAMRRRDMGEAFDVLQRMTQSAGRHRAEQNTHTLAELADQVIEDYEAARMRPGAQGVTLGWEWLDQQTGGAEAGDLITVVARPNMGKSWIITHMARQAWLAGANVLFVTMEMTGLQIARRMMGAEARINPDLIRRGQLSHWAEPELYEARTRIHTAGRWHMLTGSFKESVPVVDAAIQEFSPDIVYIDASYLMRPPAGSFRAQWELLSAVQQGLKEMAMARQRPIVQTVQYNREAAKTKKRGTEHIGGTDDVGRISTVVLDIQEGEPTVETVQRQVEITKNRERDKGAFSIEFLFNPPSFNFIAERQREGGQAGATPAGGAEDPGVQTDWMV